jgi:peptidyl-prolyl cis-trans isomerase B (cyclophilin B)
MPTYTKPSGDELTTLAGEAKTARARITTPKGDIVFSFYPDDAPLHSAAFIKLARQGFYDGLTFHRYEPGFVIQGGDPSGNGTGGPGYNLEAEFSERPHIQGTVAMARSSDFNSAGSQFYICLDAAPSLNRKYTVFGHVVEGQNVVGQIRAGDAMTKVAIEDGQEAKG